MNREADAGEDSLILVVYLNRSLVAKVTGPNNPTLGSPQNKHGELMGVGVCFGATTVQGQLGVARCSPKRSGARPTGLLRLC